MKKYWLRGRKAEKKKANIVILSMFFVRLDYPTMKTKLDIVNKLIQ